MSDPAEPAAALLLLVFGGGILWAVQAALYGGDPTVANGVLTTIAGPVIFIAVLLTITIAIVEGV